MGRLGSEMRGKSWTHSRRLARSHVVASYDEIHVVSINTKKTPFFLFDI